MAGRVTQDVVEVLAVPTSAEVRVTQDVVEVLAVPTSAVVRVSQDVVEVMVVSPAYTTGKAYAWGYILGG